MEESKSLLPKTNMKPGDNVALSTADRVALVTGSVIKIGPNSITIATERDISNTISEVFFLYLIFAIKHTGFNLLLKWIYRKCF